MDERRTFCRICSAACALVISVDGDTVHSARGDNDDVVTRGYSCPKGRSVGALHHDESRLDAPMMRDESGVLTAVQWDSCLDDLGARLRSIRDEHGPNSVAIYMATASTFDSIGSRYAARLSQGLNTRNRYSAVTLDAPCKPLIAELMAGRSDLLPAVDRERATLTVFIGVNPVVSHGHFNAFPDPIVRVRELATDPREVWVIDPRRTETARLATRHLQPRPDTDWVLLAYLVRELLEDGADNDYMAEHADGVERLRAAVAPFDRDAVVERTGLQATEVDALLSALRRHDRVAAQTGTGTTMGRSANVTEWLTWALHVVKGSYDRPGGMWFNPGFIGCHDRRRVVPAPAHVVRDTSPPSRPDLPSRMGEYPSAALVDQIESGEVRALIIFGGNPMTAFPDPERMSTALASLDVLAVADIVHTETVELATHALACTGQLERADVPYFLDQFLAEVGSRYTPAVVAPQADRRHAWRIFHELGARLDISVLPDDVDPATVTEDELLARIAARARRPFEELREARLIVDETSTFGWVEASLPDGRWRVAPVELIEQLEELAAEPIQRGLLLVPRRQLRHMNSLLRDVSASGSVDVVDVLMNPVDAAEAEVVAGALVAVRTKYGEMQGVARIDEYVRRGVVSIPHGWGGDGSVSRLLTGSNNCDPLTGMVHQSGVPVSLAPVPT